MTPDPQVISDYLDRTRWFGGKGRPYAVTDVRTASPEMVHTISGA